MLKKPIFEQNQQMMSSFDKLKAHLDEVFPAVWDEIDPLITSYVDSSQGNRCPLIKDMKGTRAKRRK